MVVKQVIVMRRFANAPRGKEIAQGAHAAMAFLSKRVRETFIHLDRNPQFTQAEAAWLLGQFTKVVVAVDTEEELLEVYENAKKAKLEAHLITDSAKTFFDEPTHTAVGIGPDYAEAIDPVTGHLKLYNYNKKK